MQVLTYPLHPFLFFLATSLRFDDIGNQSRNRALLTNSMHKGPAMLYSSEQQIKSHYVADKTGFWVPISTR